MCICVFKILVQGPPICPGGQAQTWASPGLSLLSDAPLVTLHVPVARPELRLRPSCELSGLSSVQAFIPPEQEPKSP